MLSALTALVLIVSLCLAPTRNGGLLTVLCSPMPNLISLGLVVGGTCYLSTGATKARNIRIASNMWMQKTASPIS